MSAAPTLVPYQDISAEYNAVPGAMWIDKLKYAYNEADTSGQCALTLAQWMNSRMRYVISDQRMSDEELETLYKKLDENGDERLEWDEVVTYLTSRLRVEREEGKRLILTYKYPPPPKKMPKRERVLRARYVEKFSQILSLTETTLTFWDIENCSIVRRIVDDEVPFVDFCVMLGIHKIAVAKENRRIIFIDTRSFEIISFMICASVNPRILPKMTIKEAIRARHFVESRDRVPLFHAPAALAAIYDTHLFVGDSTGRVEVFRLFPSRESRTRWDFSRLHVASLHSAAITQIDFVPDFGFFISSGEDGRLLTWRYDRDRKEVHTIYAFTDRSKSPITLFTWNVQTKDVCYATSARAVSTWRIGTPLQVTRTRLSVTTTLQIHTPPNEPPYVIAVSEDYVVTIYRLLNLEDAGVVQIGKCHESGVPTASIILEGSLFLIGPFTSCWSCRSGSARRMKPHEGQIAYVCLNDFVSAIITMDVHGECFSWGLDNGVKQVDYDTALKGTTVTSVDLDGPHKRLLIGYSDGQLQIVAVTTGGKLSEFDTRYFKGGCLDVRFGRLGAGQVIMVCNGNKAVVLFEDLVGNRTRFARNFNCPTENPVKAFILKGIFVLSLGTGREALIWLQSQLSPFLRLNLPGEASVAADLPADPVCFLVGDDSGYIHIVSVKTGAPVKSIDGFGMRIPSPVTSLMVCPTMNLIVSTNGTGYIKFFSIDDLGTLKHFRGHDQSIVRASVSEKNRVFVTADEDGDVKLWSFEETDFQIGQLAAERRWDLADRQTWVGGAGLEEDPLHFASTRVPTPIVVITPQKEEEDEKDEAVILPDIFSRRRSTTADLQELVEDLENTLYGRRARLMAGQQQARERAIPPPPEPRNLAMDQLISNSELQSTWQGWRGLKNRGSVDLRTVLPRLNDPIMEHETEIPSSGQLTMAFRGLNTSKSRRRLSIVERW
jgi:WD40 repeat protein